MADCDFCGEHGTNVTDLKWTMEKVKLHCHEHEKRDEAMWNAIDKCMKWTTFSWLFGGALTLFFALLLVMFGELRAFSSVANEKLSMMAIEQGRACERVESLSGKISDMVRDQNRYIRKSQQSINGNDPN